MIELRTNPSQSWLDAETGRILGWALGQRLTVRCRGHAGLFVTLTYRRSDHRDAQDCYRRQSDEQHVPLFIRKVSRYLHRDLRGKWICKVEFQRGGWMHFHLIILDVDRIPHEALAQMWGHGFVWVNKLSPHRIKYACKYVSKAGSLPAWLLMERPRSVKIVRVSHGFWESGEGSSATTRADDEADGDDDADRYFPRASVLDAYRPIGVSLAASRTRVLARDADGRYVSGRCDLGQLLSALVASGCTIEAADGRWLRLSASLSDFRALLGRLNAEAVCDIPQSAIRAASVAAPAATLADLHLTHTRVSDVIATLRMLDAWYAEGAMLDEVLDGTPDDLLVESEGGPA